jgi:hypothetical protein
VCTYVCMYVSENPTISDAVVNNLLHIQVFVVGTCWNFPSMKQEF